MKGNRKILIVVSDLYEAEQAVEFLKKNDKPFVIFALDLSSEYFLKKNLVAWTNPVYGFLGKDKSQVYKHLAPNFKISYKFAQNSAFEYVRDRLGYYLTEMDRSLEFAKRVFAKTKPKLLVTGEMSQYPGASVINGSLKKNALLLLAKSRSVKVIKLKSTSNNMNLRQHVGKFVGGFGNRFKQKMPDSADVLVIASARHMVMLAPLVKSIRKKGLNVELLTYNLTIAFKKQLSRVIGKCLDKTRLTDSEIKNQAKKLKRLLVLEKHWLNFKHPAYFEETVTSYLIDKIKNIVDFEFDDICEDIFLAKKVLGHIKPGLLITVTDPDTRVMAYINYAKANGIKSVCLQHGAFLKVDPPVNAPLSDFFITWSKITKKTLSDNPYFRNVHMLIGQSPFHRLNNSAKKNRSRKDKKTVLLLTAIDLMDINLKMYFYKKLFFAFEMLGPGYEFIVRSNPFQVQNNLKVLVENTSARVILDDKSNLHSAISKSDIVIYENTTAGLDAMLLSKPTIYFNPYTGADYYGVENNRASMVIDQSPDLENKLANFLKNTSDWTEYRKYGKVYAQKYLGLDGSREYKRLVHLISTLAGHKL